MRARRHIAHAAGMALMLGCFAAVAAAGISTPQVYRDASGSIRLEQHGYDGTGTTVAIIDTGIADVPELSGVVLHQENLSAAPDAGDQFGHGTFVAGLVHRTAPGAKLVSVKLSGADGSVDVTQVLAALQWVVANRDRYGIDVVNISFGNDSKQSWRTSPLNYAVEQAWDNGIVVVSSAGNLGDHAGTVTKPGDDPVIISVGATDDQGTGDTSDDAVAPFGSRGPTQDGLAKPDIVAPGSHVVSLRAPGSTIDTAHPEARTGDWEFRGSGTSFAAPIVAGIAAQLLQSHPNLNPDQVKYALLHGATSVSGDGSAQGSGTVRGMRALNAISGSANAGSGRSSGTGTIDGARGSARVKVKVAVATTDGARATVAVDVAGETTPLVDPAAAPVNPDAVATDDVAPTAVLQEFDHPAYAPTPPVVDSTIGQVHDLLAAPDPTPAASQWGASQWGASQWGASQWGASQWGASQWGASQWGASQWGASQWGASQWWASQWG